MVRREAAKETASPARVARVLNSTRYNSRVLADYEEHEPTPLTPRAVARAPGAGRRVVAGTGRQRGRRRQVCRFAGWRHGARARDPGNAGADRPGHRLA